MLASILVGGILAALTFVGLTLADRRNPTRWCYQMYAEALRKRRSPHIW